jgi:hypothetical protein
MKRFISIMLILTLVMVLASCANNSETSSDNSSNVKVDEGLLLNKVTIPATFFEDTSEDEIKAAAEEAGYQSYKINSDGSVTYTMTKAKHQEMLNEYAASINEYIDGLLNGDEETKVEGFSNIECNDDYSEVNIYVNKDTYTMWDMMYALSFYIQGGYYQMFNGVSSEDVDVEVNFIDNVSGDIIDSGSYRTWVDNLEESSSINDNTGDVSSSANDTVSKTLNLNETVTIGSLMEITLTGSEWVESITPSNTSGVYSYYEDQEGEKYFVIHGTLKNIGSENLDIQWINESEVLLNGTYKFSAKMELESNDGTDFYGSAKPLQTLNLIIYASVSDEAYEICETVDLTMNILSDPEYVNNFYDDDYQHETLKISFTK